MQVRRNRTEWESQSGRNARKLIEWFCPANEEIELDGLGEADELGGIQAVEEDMEEPQEIRILHNPEVARKRKREDYVEGQESIERLVRKMNDIEQKMEIIEREREKYETKSSGSKDRGRKRVCGL
jgi:hypothetical protein